MLRLMLILLSLSCAGCTHMAQDDWTGKDKAEHFASSAVLAAAGSEYGKHQHWHRDQNAGFGLLFSISLGASKEAWDSRPAGSGWSWKDFAWDIAGATTGYTLWRVSQ